MNTLFNKESIISSYSLLIKNQIVKWVREKLYIGLLQQKDFYKYYKLGLNRISKKFIIINKKRL